MSLETKSDSEKSIIGADFEQFACKLSHFERGLALEAYKIKYRPEIYFKIIINACFCYIAERDPLSNISNSY